MLSLEGIYFSKFSRPRSLNQPLFTVHIHNSKRQVKIEFKDWGPASSQHHNRALHGCTRASTKPARTSIYMCIDCRLACPRCMGLTLPRTAVSFNFNKWSKSCIVTVRSWRWEVLFFRACIALLIAYNHSFLNRGLAHTNTFLPPCKQQEKEAVRNIPHNATSTGKINQQNMCCCGCGWWGVQ